MKYINGDILEVKEGYIMQQCNCVSLSPFGLSSSLEEKFPGTCPYRERTRMRNMHNVATPESRSVPGTVAIRGTLVSPVLIINIFGQYCPGYPGNAGHLAQEAKISDTREAREKYFQEALEGLVDYFSGTEGKVKIAVPHKIGCGLAKGDWKVYEKMLENFENEMLKAKVDLEMTVYVWN